MVVLWTVAGCGAVSDDQPLGARVLVSGDTGAPISVATRADPDTDVFPTVDTLPVLDPSTDPVPTTVVAAPIDAIPSEPSAPVDQSATEAQVAVLLAEFDLPGRPDLHDINGGQVVTVGNRSLAVNVPIRGTWQYADLDAQDLPGATNEESEAAARSLLVQLGIDATGLVPTFTPNGPSVDIALGPVTLRFANDGRLAWAIGAIAAIP